MSLSTRYLGTTRPEKASYEKAYLSFGSHLTELLQTDSDIGHTLPYASNVGTSAEQSVSGPASLSNITPSIADNSFIGEYDRIKADWDYFGSGYAFAELVGSRLETWGPVTNSMMRPMQAGPNSSKIKPIKGEMHRIIIESPVSPVEDLSRNYTWLGGQGDNRH